MRARGQAIQRSENEDHTRRVQKDGGERHHHRRPGTIQGEGGRLLLYPCRQNTRHRNWLLRGRDTANQRRDLPHLRLQAQGQGRQLPTAAHQGSCRVHRLHRAVQLSTGIQTCEESGCQHRALPLFLHRCLRSRRTYDARLL